MEPRENKEDTGVFRDANGVAWVRDEDTHQWKLYNPNACTGKASNDG